MRLKSNHDKPLRLADNRILPAGGEIFVPNQEWDALQHDTNVKVWLDTKHVETVSDEAPAAKSGPSLQDTEKSKRSA